MSEPTQTFFRIEDFLEDTDSNKNKHNKNHNHSHNDKVSKHQQEFGHRKRIKP